MSEFTVRTLEYSLPILAVLGCAPKPAHTPELAPVACAPSTPLPNIASSFATPSNRSKPLGTKDWRRPYTGKWFVRFTVKEVQELIQEPHLIRSAMHPVIPPCTATGVLTILDTVALPPPGDAKALRARLDMDFSGISGGPIAWLGLVSLERYHDSLALDLTPGCHDCGVRALLQDYGDSLAGRWGESAFIGATRAGSLTLRREGR